MSWPFVDKFELEIVVMYAGMIVGYRYDNDVTTITWIGSCGTLCERAVKLIMKGTSVALPFVRNGELYALMIDNKQPCAGKVVKVSDSLECTHIGSRSTAKMIGADTYIYMSPSILNHCVLVKFAGDACNVDAMIPHPVYEYHDGERFWGYRVTLSGKKHYVSSDPAYWFKMPDQFGYMVDARNGLILNLNSREGLKGKYTIYILCSKARGVIWAHTSDVGECIDFIRVEFSSDNVVVTQITCIDARITRYVFINTVDNTVYEIARYI